MVKFAVVATKPSEDVEDFLPAANLVDIESGGKSASFALRKSKKHTGSQSHGSIHRYSTVARHHRASRASKAGSRMYRASVFSSLLNKDNDEFGNEKPKILALHGKSSNGEVTKLQLSNLGITADKYNIVYLDGPILEEQGDPAVVDFVSGPFYSWFHGNHNDARFRASFFKAIGHVYTAVQSLGPFDAIYGFSQGATVASFTALSFTDDELQTAIRAAAKQSDGRKSIMAKSVLGRSFLRKSSVRDENLVHFQVERGSKGKTAHQGASFLSKMTIASQADLDDEFFRNDPFQYMVLACPIDDPAAIRNALRLKGVGEEIHVPATLLIGMSDPRKHLTEKMVSIMADAQVKYMVGGHTVNRLVAGDKQLLESLQVCLREGHNVVEMEAPEMKKISDITSMGLMSKVQVAHVKLNQKKMVNTLLAALKLQDRSKALFYNARDSSGTSTSYGDVIDFIQGGAGDLRRIHVNEGEVVAYGAPPGGGAVPALAFLSIMAQTSAAPLAPGTQESDALYFLEQFSAKHLILFEGVDNPGVEAAFIKYAASGKAVLHRATIQDGGKPGFFDYTQTGEQRLDPGFVPASKSLSNPANGVGLLLGTSGTTSKPKGVPISQASLVQNGAILASSVGLKESDVCYSIMPLFHIGGISASILCSIAAGGSICCDNEGYNPENMVDALALSKPQPTWYSSVPTIHNATVAFIRDMAGSSPKLTKYGVADNGIWTSGHSLRMIRSGAAALLAPDALRLAETYGGLPIIPTYSMSEQMPISQPPAGKMDMITDKPGSVGVPVAASMAIVNSSTLRPMPYGQEGEIAICGPTVIDKYLNNQEADKKTYFQLTLPTDSFVEAGRGRFFLTGDVGVLDKEGFLSLKGRNKELIKKGGEQISPFEIEEPLLDHPWVGIVVCFAVSSQIYGEEAGAAIVLASDAPAGVQQDEVIKELRSWLQKSDVAPAKWPTKWKVVDDDELLKTKTKKYIRIGLSKHLGFEDEEEVVAACPLAAKKPSNNTFIDWDVISGFRFLLACYVMFMHLGANDSWGAFNNLRGWPWHVHVFFTLGGFSLSAPMNPVIGKKFKYFWARIMGMYPMYAVALIFVFANLLVVCRPSTFRSDYHWDAQPDDLYIDGDKSKGLSPLFCEGTPATPNSYWASLFLTIAVYVTGSAITPIYLMNWWMGFYFWFSAMYYQCLMIFPAMYNGLSKWRSETKKFVVVLMALFVLNFVILIVTWFASKDYQGYNHYDVATGDKNSVDLYNEDGHKHNVTLLSWYLFSPFWMLYFVIGAVTAFLYDAYRPAEKANIRAWGYVADGCTLLVIAWSICLIAQGNIAYDFDNEYALRPDEANNYIDTAQTNRLWDNLCGRFVAPMTTLWVFALSTGEGYTASVLRIPFLVTNIAPHSYNCFLFHQPVAQWYYAATRNGTWWNWWRYRKTMYWFSPGPVPVEWYEYFYLVVLTVGFSALMNATALPFVNAVIGFLSEIIFGQGEDEEVNLADALVEAIEDMSGFAPELDWTLDQCGLSSVGLPQLAQRLQKALSGKGSNMTVTAASLSSARTVGDIVKVLQEIKDLSKADGI